MLLRMLKTALANGRPGAAPTPPVETREAALQSVVEAAVVDITNATTLFSGPEYREVLAWLHRRLSPRTYIEIGVSRGKTITLASPSTQAIGVDPEPAIDRALGANTRIFKMTSDAFFAAHDPRELFEGIPVDLSFIDGMHHCEYALRDFVALERWSAPESTILAHDCYPLDRKAAERERQTVVWTGDCWRFVIALKRYRPDLILQTIATAPSGLVVIRNLDPESRVLEQNMEAIVAEMLALDYSMLEADKPGMLNLLPNDWESIERLFV